MELTKMNSNGNCFLILDNRSLTYSNTFLSDLALGTCNVKTGIGADGLLVVTDSENQDFHFTMQLFNSDGSEAGMCGNGAKCLAKYAHDQNLCPEKAVFQTASGIIQAEIKKNLVKITPEPIDLKTLRKLEDLTALHVLVPHAVIEIGEASDQAHYQLGSALNDKNALFPLGTNVNFVTYISKNKIKVHTYERGVNAITDSCGTGAIASTLVMHEKYGLTSPVDVIHPGGVNRVYFHIDEKSSQASVSLEGLVDYNSHKIQL